MMIRIRDCDREGLDEVTKKRRLEDDERVCFDLHTQVEYGEDVSDMEKRFGCVSDVEQGDSQSSCADIMDDNVSSQDSLDSIDSLCDQSYNSGLLAGNLSNVKVYKGNVDTMEWRGCRARPYKGVIQSIWSYFKENCENNLYRCKLCSMVLKIDKHQNGNTVRILKKHISRSGSKYYRCTLGADPDVTYIGGCDWEEEIFLQQQETLDSNPMAKTMTPNDYIWYVMNSTNQPMSFADDKAVIELANVLKKQNGGKKHAACNSTNIKKILHQDVKEIDQFIMKEIERSNRVLSTPLVISSRQDFEQNCIAKINKMSQIHFFSLVLDHWSDTRLRSFIGVIAVIWDKYEKTQRSFVLGMPETLNHTSSAIVQQLGTVVDYYSSLNTLVVSTLSDNASSVRKACSGLHEKFPNRLIHVNCVNHSLNVINSKLVTEPGKQAITAQNLKLSNSKTKVKIIDYDLDDSLGETSTELFNSKDKLNDTQINEFSIKNKVYDLPDDLSYYRGTELLNHKNVCSLSEELTDVEENNEDTLIDFTSYNAESPAETFEDVYDIFYEGLFGSNSTESSFSGAHKLLESINILESECKRPFLRKKLRDFTSSNNLGDIDCLIPYVKTRWTYSVLCFERALLLSPCLLSLMKENLISPLLEQVDFEFIRIYIIILKPFKTITSFFSSADTTARYLIPALKNYRDTVMPHVVALKLKLQRSYLLIGTKSAKITTILAQIERFMDKIKQYIESYEEQRILLVASYFNCGFRDSPYLMQKLNLEYEEHNNKRNNELLSGAISDLVSSVVYPMLNIKFERDNNKTMSTRIPGITSIVFEDGSETVDNDIMNEESCKYLFKKMVLKEVRSFNAQYNKIHVKFVQKYMEDKKIRYNVQTKEFILSNGTKMTEYEYLLFSMKDIHHGIWAEIKDCPIICFFNHLMDSIAVSSTHIEHIFSISAILTGKRRGRVSADSLEERMKTKIAYQTLGNYHKFNLQQTSLDQLLFVKRLGS